MHWILVVRETGKKMTGRLKGGIQKNLQEGPKPTTKYHKGSFFQYNQFANNFPANKSQKLPKIIYMLSVFKLFHMQNKYFLSYLTEL